LWLPSEAADNFVTDETERSFAQEGLATRRIGQPRDVADVALFPNYGAARRGRSFKPAAGGGG